MISEKIRDILFESADLAVEECLVSKLTESPIEMLFAVAFWSRFDWRGLSVSGSFGNLQTMKRVAALEMPKVVWSPQVTISGMRVDFLFCQEMMNNEPLRMVAVECDGHEFHERTKQQAAKDKSRDRRLAAAGVTVLRFTGSEIYKAAGMCAEEVFLLLSGGWADSYDRESRNVIFENVGGTK